jgi:hypothetical protein
MTPYLDVAIEAGLPNPRWKPLNAEDGNTPASELVFNAVHSRMVHSVQWLIRLLNLQSPERTRHAEIKDCIRGQYLRGPRVAGRCYRRYIDSIVWLLFSDKLFN